VPSVQHPEADTSPNGVNTQDVDVEADANTISESLDDEWTDAEIEEARQIGYDRGASYAVLPGWVANDPSLTPPMLCALVQMSMHAAGDRLNVSQAQLSFKLRVTQQAVSKTMARLAEIGYIQKLNERGRPAWRLRWLTNRAQPQVVRAVPNPQPTVVDAQPQVVPTQPTVVAHAHALSPVLNSSDGSVVKTSSSSRKPKAAPVPLSDEERAKRHTKYGRFYPSAEALDDVIDIALNHVAVDKAKGEYRYAMGWVQRDIRDRKLFKAKLDVEKARETRFKTPYGESLYDPKVSTPAPFLTHSAADLPPFHDYTKD